MVFYQNSIAERTIPFSCTRYQAHFCSYKFQIQGSVSSDDVLNFERVIEKYTWAGVRSELKSTQESEEFTSLIRYTSKKRELLKMTAIQELLMVNYII